MIYDVLILGGAMAGSTLALALATKTQGRLRVAVIERQPLPQRKDKIARASVDGAEKHGFDARCIALSDGSCRCLNEIVFSDRHTLWQSLSPFTAPISTIHISDKGHSGLVRLNSAEHCLSQFGAVIALEQAGEVLLDETAACPNIDYISSVSVERIDYHQDYVEISLSDHRTLQAKLLVGADGNASQVAKAAKIAIKQQKCYEHSAIIANVQTQKPHQNQAFERFTSQGPIALLPLPAQACLSTLVWCVKNDNVQSMISLNTSEFLTALQDHFGWRLGKFNDSSRPIAYPLNLYQCEHHIAHRTALVGNAAQTLHPIAGQGFNLGMRDVITLAQLISRAFLGQQDIGEYALLMQYEQKRRIDQARTISFTDGLVSVFANELLPVQIGRNIGLTALAQSSLLRQCFAKTALGWR